MKNPNENTFIPEGDVPQNVRFGHDIVDQVQEEVSAVGDFIEIKFIETPLLMKHNYTQEDTQEKRLSAEAETSFVQESTDEACGTTLRECYYEEQVKKKTKKYAGILKFIAGTVIVSILGGGSIGAGYGLINRYFIQESTTIVTRMPVTVQSVSASTEGLRSVDIVKAVKPSVVSISTTVSGTAEYFGSFSIPYEATGAGSGIIFHADETRVAIVTNNHVVEGMNAIYVVFDNETAIPAKVIGTRSESDLALLSISWEDLKSAGIMEVSVAAFGDSDSLEVGESVIAMGNAMGMGISATDGIISMKEQIIVVDDNELMVVQTSAAINSGNSGGALVNGAGEVIGINTAKYNSTMTEGMGYAIPSNVIMPIAEELLELGTIPTPHIGIRGTSITTENADLYKLPVGALIMEVAEGGPAEVSGIMVGDIITEFNGKIIMDMNMLVEAVGEVEIGQEVDVHIIRNGQSGIDLRIIIEDKNA